MKHLRNAAALLAVGALLAACGGESAAVDATGAPNEVPAAALASPESYARFAASLEPNDAAEPLNLDTVAAAPSSDTSLPIGI